MKCSLCENISVVRGYCRACYEKLKKDDGITYKKHSETLVYGAGINDMPKGWAKANKRIYRLWADMLRRCYSDKYHEKRPNYKGCTVCDKWIKLSGFAEDLPYIEGYEMWVNGYKDRVALDKDTIIYENKLYSKDRCKFLSASDNSREGQFRNGRQKQVVRISSYGSIKIYESTIAPQHEDGFRQSRVYQCCAHKDDIYNGYKWMFLDEYEEENT